MAAIKIHYSQLYMINCKINLAETRKKRCAFYDSSLRPHRKQSYSIVHLSTEVVEWIKDQDFTWSFIVQYSIHDSCRVHILARSPVGGLGFPEMQVREESDLEWCARAHLKRVIFRRLW